MKYRMLFLLGAVVAFAACGPAQEPEVDVGASPTSAVAPAIPLPSFADLSDLRDAPPEPISQPHFKPVPEPVPAPAPKPVRPNPPIPPPPRSHPGVPVTDPVLTPKPPAQDLQPGSVSPMITDRVSSVIADLADSLDVDPSIIEVLDARLVTWRDGSVGCPSPGLAYTQAEVPGYLVVLRVGDTSYPYHAADARVPFLCQTPQAPLEGSA